MATIALAILALLAIAAAAFACGPVLRRRDRSLRARLLLAGAVAALTIGIGGGAYLILGSPYLAARNLAGPSAHDLRSLVAALARRMPDRPNDAQGWTLLGRSYLTLGDGAKAAAAFKRAIAVATPAGRPALLSAYGEALTLASGGAVTTDAEAVFNAALRGNPKDFAARYYLGLAYAARRDSRKALAMWKSLLADAPPNAPWRAGLVERVAMLTARTGAADPDIGAMVASLVHRLRSQRNDPEGWRRLVRAYAALGDTAKAKQALAQARATLKSNPPAQAQLAREARKLKLE